MIDFLTYLSPIGPLQFEVSDLQIQRISFAESGEDTATFDRHLKNEILAQMDGYFEGKLFEFDLPLNPKGTDFQKRVWQQLQTIEYGHQINYGELALKMGDKNLMRAVGGANSKNPIAIVVPCHRVIGTNNKLVGYAGGIWRKKWLLQHEITHRPTKTTLF